MKEHLISDGVELCPECSLTVLVWIIPEDKRREFDLHYSEYPKYCKGVPSQTVFGTTEKWSRYGA